MHVKFIRNAARACENNPQSALSVCLSVTLMTLDNPLGQKIVGN